MNTKFPPGTKAHFLNLLSGTLQPDDETWILDKPLYFYSAELDRVIETPAASKTDFCSVPRIPIVYSIAGNKYKRSGALHDNTYATRMFPRGICDDLLHEALISEGCHEMRADEFYLGVRAFGGSHYGDKD